MQYLLLVPVLLFSFVVHEYAHAWVALREGDPTGYQLGRVTLNPLPHIDLFGTILVPALLIATHSGFLIGWAKPVPVVSRNFRNYRRSDILVSLAGVAANFLMAVACTVLVVLLIYAVRWAPGASTWLVPLREMALFGIQLNFILVVFNLLPVPPLDGSHVVYHLLPARAGAAYRRFERYGLAVFALLLITGTIGFLLTPAIALQDLSLAFIRWLT